MGGLWKMSRRSILRKDGNGVSPVIAAILMVSMSVVLAAVLYVMTLGIADTGTTVTPVMSTAKTTDDNNYIWTIVAISGGHPVLRGDIYVQLKNETGFIIATEPLVDAGNLTSCNGTHGFKYTAASAGDYIGVGDKFALDKAYTQGCTITLVTPSATSLYTVMTV